DGGVTGHVQLDHGRDVLVSGEYPRLCDVRLRVEAAEIREPPVLLGRVRDRQALVGGECVGSAHPSYGLWGWWSRMRCPAGSLKPAPWQTPESQTSLTGTPAASSFSFASTTSGTPRAIVPGGSGENS